MWDRIIFVPIATIIGLIMGSFYNVLIYRLPRGISLVNPKRSFCPVCKHTLTWRDNIPLLSYALLKGQCRYCGARISVRYPIVEASTAFLFLIAVYLSNNVIDLVALWMLFSAGLVASAIDFEYMLIPDSMVVITAGAGILWSWSHNHLFWSVLTAAFAFGIFFLIRLLSKNGMGFGDVEYFGALALFLTPFSAVIAVLLASVSALVFVVPMFFTHKVSRKTRVPFGPFLAIGTSISIFLNFHV